MNYVESESKTINFEWNDPLENVIDYAANPLKTAKQFYVTGINCDPAIARQQMNLTKQRWGKEGGNVAFHGYQSFLRGETTPDMAHKIGIEFVQSLWGDRFEAIVVTHVNTRCVHNHFIINSVSFLDGGRYNDCKATYKELRRRSDEICRSYALSNIENPRRKGRHRSEWQAEQDGQPTWRGLIRSDIDEAITHAANMNQFIANMKGLGYEVKNRVKHWAVRPDGKERFIRLDSLGDGYSQEDIAERLSGQIKASPNEQLDSPHRRIRVTSLPKPAIKMKGLQALYFYYLYKIGALPKYKPSSKRRSFLCREEQLKFKRYLSQMNLLRNNGIETTDQLQSFKGKCQSKLDALIAQRNEIHSAQRKESDETIKSSLREQATVFSAQVKTLRSDIKCCDAIEADSQKMRQSLSKIESKQSEGMKDDKHRSGRGRPDR